MSLSVKERIFNFFRSYIFICIFPVVLTFSRLVKDKKNRKSSQAFMIFDKAKLNYPTTKIYYFDKEKNIKHDEEKFSEIP